MELPHCDLYITPDEPLMTTDDPYRTPDDPCMIPECFLRKKLPKQFRGKKNFTTEGFTVSCNVEGYELPFKTGSHTYHKILRNESDTRNFLERNFVISMRGARSRP